MQVIYMGITFSVLFGTHVLPCIYMGSKHSEAMKLYWSKIDPDVRSCRASATAKSKWAKATTEEKRAHAMKMVEARKHSML